MQRITKFINNVVEITDIFCHTFLKKCRESNGFIKEIIE